MKIEKINYNCYEDFLQDLSPSKWLYNIQNFFVYRGQGEDFDLLPSIYRTPKNILKIYAPEEYIKKECEFAYRCAEYNLLKEFFINSNKTGLIIPHNSFNNYDYISNCGLNQILKIISKEWLPDDMIEIAALAQHYGVPTRLLDWSFDINVALYFATKNALSYIVKNQFINNSKMLVVWLLNFTNLNEKSISDRNFPLRYIIPDYYNNPNLNAQKGLLTCWKSTETSIDNLTEIKRNTKTLNELLIENTNKYSAISTDVAMYKITIPHKETLKIFKHLSKNGYHGARLFPGYFGVIRKMEEDRLISEAEPYFNESGWRGSFPEKISII